MMRKIYLSDYPGGDDRERIAAALDDARRVPGTTLVVEPGEYRITTPRSREIRRALMCGEYGSDPERVMFTPDFPYDRGIDLSGHVGTVVDGTGARLMIDGFMEDISIRDCEGVRVRGFEIDNVRKPYTKAVIESVGDKAVKARLSQPITDKTPVVRTCIYSFELGRFIPEICDVDSVASVDGEVAAIKLKGDSSRVSKGDEIYLCHTFHFRPSVLIEDAKNITVENVTVHSHSGMGLTAFHGEDITLDGFRVVPAVGEHFSTNTDATHFTSCRGYLKIKNCAFVGQGDDGINVHTYYFTPEERIDEKTVVLTIKSPTWTHTQRMDSPSVGDRFDLTDERTLRVIDSFYVASVACDRRSCTVTLDRDLPRDLVGCLFASPDMTPSLEVRGSSFRNHFARGMTLKMRKCLIENCEMTDLFELPIKLAPEAYWREGVGCEEMTVRNCTFKNCGRLKYCVPRFECGGIEVFSDSPEHAAVHGRVTVENNIIECPECDHAIMLRDLERASLSGNRLTSKGDPLVLDDKVKIK